MKEGEPVLGGGQANPGGIQTPTPGTQPVVSATPQSVQPQPITSEIKILNNEESSDTIENIMNKIYDMIASSVYALKNSCKSINLIVNGGNNE